MADPVRVAVVNVSTVCSDSEVRHWTAALQSFMPEFARVWGIDCDLGFASSGQNLDDGMWLQLIADTAEQAGYLGYHETTRAGFPIGYTFAKTGRAGGNAVSVTLSHELWEMLANPYIDKMVPGPDGRSWAYENADAVEADECAIEVPMPSGSSVLVSDFVTPAYFDPAMPAGSVYDYRGLLHSPLPTMLPGGYLAFQEPSGAWGQLTAFATATARAAARPQPLSRRYRAMLRSWQAIEAP